MDTYLERDGHDLSQDTCSVLVTPRNISMKWIERGAGLSTVVKEINDFPLPGSKPRPNWLSQVALRHYVGFCIWSSLSRYPSTVGWWCTLLWKYALTWKEHQYIQRWIKIWKQTCNISILIRSADLHIIQTSLLILQRRHLTVLDWVSLIKIVFFYLIYLNIS